MRTYIYVYINYVMQGILAQAIMKVHEMTVGKRYKLTSEKIKAWDDKYEEVLGSFGKFWEVLRIFNY